MILTSYWESFEQTFQGIFLKVEQFGKILVQISDRVQKQLVETTNHHQWGESPISFTALQWTLFKVLLLLLLATVLLIAYAWRVYGEVITDKFVRPSKFQDDNSSRLSPNIEYLHCF